MSRIYKANFEESTRPIERKQKALGYNSTPSEHSKTFSKKLRKEKLPRARSLT